MYDLNCSKKERTRRVYKSAKYSGLFSGLLIIMVAVTFKYDTQNCPLYLNWLKGQFLLEAVGVLRELCVLLVFKFAENPKPVDLQMGLFQVLVIWSFALAWAVYGTCNQTECDSEAVARVQLVYIYIDFFIVFFYAMIVPKIMYQSCIILYKRIYLSMLKYSTRVRKETWQ